MKKLLFGILTILGIGLSFCSADSWYMPTDDYIWLGVGNNFGQYFNAFYLDTSYSVNSIDSLCLIFGSDYIDSYNVNLSDYYIVLSDGNGNYSFSDSNYNYYYDQDSKTYYCYNFSSSLGVPNNSLVRFGFHNNSNPNDTSLSIDLTDYYLGWRAVECRNNVYSVNDGQVYFGCSDNYNFFGTAILYAGISYSEKQTAPKFKVNYGSTSYEYELEDNLFIYLKSPVIQNGNIFTYNGSTGLNLFYNGTSQWYDKSNLYLESMFWYNNNIFTPICL